MARIRILELPMVHVGEATEMPFVVILDQVASESPLIRGQEAERLRETAEKWGARGVLVTADTIELADEASPVSVAEVDGGHRFGVPGYLDPQRCAQCGLDRESWIFGRDRRTCAEVQAKAVR